MLALIPAAIGAVGLAQGLAGLVAALRFHRRRTPVPAHWPALTVLKPLHGEEPLLEAALASFCAQDYPDFQLVFGVQRADDRALSVVRRLQARFPARDIAVVVDPARHGRNGKVSNLVNMLPAARHDVILISDADIHAAPDYLRRVAAELAQPGIGLVTSLYAGLPAGPGLAPRLAATQISHAFLPGALLARGLGRQDCLGATMALRRETLAAIGGLPALAAHLADDNRLGVLVRRLGLGVGLAATVPTTTCAEADLAGLLRHERRWARTIRSLAPAGFAASAVQYPLFWMAAAALLGGLRPGFLALFGAAWAIRAASARALDHVLGLATAAPVWLLPLRDLISIANILASFVGDTVEWRGQAMLVDRHARG